jgi:hypothetical protein
MGLYSPDAAFSNRPLLKNTFDCAVAHMETTRTHPCSNGNKSMVQQALCTMLDVMSTTSRWPLIEVRAFAAMKTWLVYYITFVIYLSIACNSSRAFVALPSQTRASSPGVSWCREPLLRVRRHRSDFASLCNLSTRLVCSLAPETTLEEKNTHRTMQETFSKLQLGMHHIEPNVTCRRPDGSTVNESTLPCRKYFLAQARHVCMRGKI